MIMICVTSLTHASDLFDKVRLLDCLTLEIPMQDGNYLVVSEIISFIFRLGDLYSLQLHRIINVAVY